MDTDNDLSRASWNAAVKLAAVISGVSAAIAMTLTTLGGISDSALVLSVIVVGFVASWVQTERIYRGQIGREATLFAGRSHHL